MIEQLTGSYDWASATAGWVADGEPRARTKAKLVVSVCWPVAGDGGVRGTAAEHAEQCRHQRRRPGELDGYHVAGADAPRLQPPRGPCADAVELTVGHRLLPRHHGCPCAVSRCLVRNEYVDELRHRIRKPCAVQRGQSWRRGVSRTCDVAADAHTHRAPAPANRCTMCILIIVPARR